MGELARVVMVVVMVGVAVAIGLAMATLGSLLGVAIATGNYFKAFGNNVKAETAAAIPKGEEPAVRSYFYGKGYRDLRATVEDSWRGNLASATQMWGKGDAAGEVLPSIICYGAAVAIMIYGTIFFVGLSLFHAALLATCYLLVGALFISVFSAERVYLAFRGFLTVCPACHARTSLPVYLCDGCKVPHRRLLPSSHGTFHHHCSCGQKLPATFFLNRGRLASRCGKCGHFLSRTHSETTKSVVPIIGGPSVGKSAYMVWLVDELRRGATMIGQTVAFMDTDEEKQYEARLEAMRRGRMPVKTVSTNPAAFNLLFERQGIVESNTYLYDPAGEAFAGEAELAPHRFLEYCSGILLLIDPFSIPTVQRSYDIDVSRPGALKPSMQRPDDLVDKLLFVLEKNFGYDPASPLPIPIAVVLTKVDAFDLEKLIGYDGLPSALDDAGRESACSDRIATQLRSWDMTPLVETIETRFATRRFFSYSAVGFGSGPRATFEPERAGRPFAWLREQEAKSLKRRKLQSIFVR